MRRLPPLLLLLAGPCIACGGGADVGSRPKQPTQEDREFIAYVASHGIRTLGGGGNAAVEVAADGLRLERLDKSRPVKLDGVLDEWPAPAKATIIVTGATSAGLKIALQYDETKLYVGADVTDAKLAAGRDHVLLVFAVPTPGGGYVPYELSLYAGKPGESEGSVRYAHDGNVPGAKIVEAPTGPGYSFEATLPWTSLPEMQVTRVGIHGVAAYVDGDGTIATGPGDAQHPRDMAWVPSEPELVLIDQILRPKGLTGRAPDVELVADLTGDGQRERVAVWENILTICGVDYLDGDRFFFRDLPGQLVKLEARGVTGRGRADLVVWRKQGVGDAEREYLEVLSAPSGTQEPRLTFAHEIVVRQSNHRIDNAVHLARGEIDVTVEPTTTWDPVSYREPVATDVEPILLPWGPVKLQTYRFDGTTFVKRTEVTQRDQALSASSAAPDRLSLRAAEPPTPKVSKGGDLSARVLEQYRQDRGAAGVAPTFDLKVQVTGDRRPERVVVVGRDLVVFGPGFMGGTGYAFVTLQPFADAADIKDVSARDLTGDGAADVIVRGVRRVPADGGPVVVDAMFVYSIKSDAITRVFAIETGREQNGKRVQGLVQFIPSANGRSFDVVSAPGRATGWTEKTYPWAQDPPGSGLIEPVLLPWGGIGSVRYTWNGSSFVKS